MNASELVQEIDETNKLIAQLDQTGRAIIQPAQAAAIIVKITNMQGTSLTPSQSSKLVEAVNAGFWSSDEKTQMHTALAMLMKPTAIKSGVYKPQHIQSFRPFINCSIYEAIASGDLHFDKALGLAAQQLVDIECIIPAETTCAKVVTEVIELGGYDKKKGIKIDYQNPKVQLDKVVELKHWVKSLKGNRM
jgi:hypothetical protein